MKKFIFSAIVVVSTASIVSAAKFKNDSVKHDSASNKKEYTTADAKQTPRHTAVDNKKEYTTAD